MDASLHPDDAPPQAASRRWCQLPSLQCCPAAHAPVRCVPWRKFRFLVLCICVVDELDLLFGHTSIEQLGADIIIDVERTVALWSRHIAENQLGQLLLFGVVSDAQDVVDAGI